MRSPAKPPDRNDRFRSPVKPGQASAVQAHANRQASPAQIRALASANVRAPTAATVPTVRTAAQLRGAGPQAGPNRSVAVVNRQTPARPAAPAISKAPNYTVQAPIPLSGRGQQIKATIQGTPQVAGSVEISSAGPGKAYISNLSVDQQHRRRGVAAKLIDAAIATARRQGFSAASLEARPSDNGIAPQTLVAMYRRKGFKSVGKTGRGSPLMERKL